MQGGRVTTWKEEGCGRGARAGRRPGCCAGGGGRLGALSKVQGRWVAGAEPGANTGWRRRGERGTAVWGAGHPPARKSDRAGAGIERGRARGAARKLPSFHAPLPTSLTSSFIPLPLPGAHSPPSLCPGAVAGTGPGNPRSKPGHSRDAAGPGAAACLPGAAVPGLGAARRAEPGAGRGAASPRLGVLLLRFSRTPSRAGSCKTRPGCSCGSLCCLRRRCRRQRTPRGDWKPV